MKFLFDRLNFNTKINKNIKIIIVQQKELFIFIKNLSFYLIARLTTYFDYTLVFGDTYEINFNCMFNLLNDNSRA